MTCHSWNKDRTRVALCPNNSEVWIVDTRGQKDMAKWNPDPIQILDEHSEQVTGIDWNHKTNLLATCSQDRNAYVWKWDDKEKCFKPTLVILRINRSATSIKWSPKGDKFAVTSGAKCIPVCYYEESNNWWISKMVKKHKSTVTSVDWSPDNKLIVTGSCDYKARIFSAFIEGLDDSGPHAVFGEKANEFGECLWEIDPNRGWIQDVAFSPSGSQIAFSSHGSSLHFVTLSNLDNVYTLSNESLPYHHIRFLSDNTLLAVGFDSNPTIFCKSGDKWALKGKLDPEKVVAAGPKKAGFGSAFSKFQAADSKGVTGTDDGGGSGEAKTLHKNTIEGVFVFRNAGLSPEFTTSGIDGRILFWDAKECSGIS